MVALWSFKQYESMKVLEGEVDRQGWQSKGEG